MARLFFCPLCHRKTMCEDNKLSCYFCRYSPTDDPVTWRDAMIPAGVLLSILLLGFLFAFLGWLLG